MQGARCKGKGLPANTLATTPHQCTAIDSCWEKLLELQTDQRNQKYTKNNKIGLQRKKNTKLEA